MRKLLLAFCLFGLAHGVLAQSNDQQQQQQHNTWDINDTKDFNNAESRELLAKAVDMQSAKNAKKARPAFVSLFKSTQTAITNDKLDVAAANIEKIKTIKGLNKYEESRQYLLEYWYNGKKGNKEAENDAAQKLLAIGYGNIDAEPYVEAGIRLFKRQYNNQDLGGAIETLQYLRQEPQSAAELNLIDSAVKKIDETAQQQTDIRQKIRTNETGIWAAKLIKPTFFFENINGELSSIAFHCDSKDTTLAFKPDSVMSTPEAWGACSIKVKATPNTSFNFVQLQNKPAGN